MLLAASEARKTMAAACSDAEPVFAEVLAERLGTSADDRSTRMEAP